MKWFRLWTDIVDDVKMLQLSDYEFRIWIYLMAYLSDINSTSGHFQITFKLLSLHFHLRFNLFSRAIETFQSLGLITVDENGIGTVTNWNKRQFKSDNAYERVKKFRQVKQKRNVSNPLHETAPDTDTDTDTDNTPYNPPKGDGGFSRFWIYYPRKIGKAAALKAWNKSNGKRPPIETILAAIETQKSCDQWCKDNGQYIPNPATWINQGRWDDETTTVDPWASIDQWAREEAKKNGNQ